MAANDSAVQNGTEKLSTNALTTVNGTSVTVDVIEVQRIKVGFGSDGALRDVDAANGLPVVGTFFQATQPVSAASLPLPTGASTETTLAALNTKVTAVNTGAVTISTALPTGANAIGSVSQADITASGNITTQNLVPAGVATAGSAVELTLVNAASLSIQVTGAYTGALSLQATIDNTNWITLGGTPLLNINTGGYLASITSALQSIFQAECSGFIKVRITALAAVTGTAVVSLRAVMGAAMVALDASIPAGSNLIGTVNGSGNFNVIGSNSAGNPVSGNPVAIAGMVSTSAGTNTTTGTAARITVSTSGQLSTKPYGFPETDWQYASAAGGIIATTDVVVKAAGAAGIRNYVTGIDMRNSHATVATEVVIKDGAVVIWRGQLPANSPTLDVGFMTPLRGTAATALNVACITTGASVFVNLQGYQGN